jgi:protein NrfD
MNVELDRLVSHADSAHLPWDWQIPVDLFMVAIVAGLMIIHAYRLLFTDAEDRSDRYRLSIWAAPVALGIAMVALLLDLANKLNAWRFYLSFEISAPMSWGAWIIPIVMLLTIIFGLSELPTWARDKMAGNGLLKLLLPLGDWANKPSVKRPIAWALLVLGVMFGLYTGILLSNMPSVPLWNSPVLGPLFLLNGLMMAAMVIHMFGLEDKEARAIAVVFTAFLVATIVLMAIFLLSMANGDLEQREAIKPLLDGPYAPAFWLFAIFTGLLTPLVMSACKFCQRRRRWWVTPGLVFIGGFALRWILVFAGQMQL